MEVGAKQAGGGGRGGGTQAEGQAWRHTASSHWSVSGMMISQSVAATHTWGGGEREQAGTDTDAGTEAHTRQAANGESVSGIVSHFVSCSYRQEGRGVGASRAGAHSSRHRGKQRYIRQATNGQARSLVSQSVSQSVSSQSVGQRQLHTNRGRRGRGQSRLAHRGTQQHTHQAANDRSVGWLVS